MGATPILSPLGEATISREISGFPLPYRPWERGTNENTNGLLREFFTKHQGIEKFADAYMEKVVRKLNNCPRKCLRWRTPDEAHLEEALHLI